MEKKPTLWERYVTKEIGIEFKACLYFFAILFYVCVYKICMGTYVVDILHMAEMIGTTYIIGYIQVYLLWNFDEAEQMGKKEIFAVVLCTGIYTLLAYAFKWFDRNIYVTLGFFLYIAFTYVCVFLIYKCRRKIDDKILNSDLDLFKTKIDNDSKE